MLVNDLDIRFIAPDGTVHAMGLRDRPAQDATKGDNFRDNIKQYEILEPMAGTYTLQITHKGSLVGGQQGFSLIANSEPYVNTRTTFFWTGGSGDWNDPSNWETSSNTDEEDLYLDLKTG